MHIVPDHTALLPVPPDADPIQSKNHEYKWYKYNNPDNLPLNDLVRAKKWGIRLPSGDRLDQSGDILKDYSPMGYTTLFRSFTATGFLVRRYQASLLGCICTQMWVTITLLWK